MTKDGKQNRFGRFIFEDKQAERVQSGDMSAVWEFIEDNRGHLTAWAKQFIRNRLNHLPEGYCEADELLNQIYVDFPLYKLKNDETLGKSIFCSFLGITCGGARWNWKHRQHERSLDKPTGDEDDDGESGTLHDLLPSCDPIPSAVLERQEHVEEIAPRYFHEIGQLFTQSESGASAFQDVIEEIFFGYTFEEVEAYATKRAA